MESLPFMRWASHCLLWVIGYRLLTGWKIFFWQTMGTTETSVQIGRKTVFDALEDLNHFLEGAQWTDQCTRSLSDIQTTMYNTDVGVISKKWQHWE